MTLSERRRFRRVPLPAQIQAEAGGAAYSVRAENISAGGMLLRAERTLEQNQKVSLRFMLPGTKKEIQVTGVVLHVSPGAFMGISFENLSDEAKTAIQAFVESNEPVE